MRHCHARSRPGSPARRPSRASQPQAKLRVGVANDPLEREADQVADAVVSNQGGAVASSTGPVAIQRKCAACEGEERETIRLQREDEDEEEIQMKAGGGSAVRSASSATAAATALNGPGAPLPSDTRTYFEPRLGRGLADVRVHDDRKAHEASRTLGARAYTLGQDIAFAAGEYDPRSPAGRHLLAHELAHVVQQTGGGNGTPATIRRRLVVDNPSANIPNPGGRGVTRTNAETVRRYLSELCASGAVAVDPGGTVAMSADLCSSDLVASDFVGPLAPNQRRDPTPTGCSCLCNMIASANDWRIVVDDVNWPHTRFSDHAKANTIGSGGSGGLVTTPSPNSDKIWGATTVSGADMPIDPWLVLGHELCGHAWLGDRGEHGSDIAAPRGGGGHQTTVARENLIRQEHGIEARGSYRDPHCGESFWRDRARPGAIHRSSFMAECRRWRAEYNRRHGTRYRLSERIPP